ncbi:hypothetical protein SDC9_147561 [bioreactor metagenome]|uniref:DUF4973 domain-containing protein n=1 Tax=bioreactor metagenome TaxID=1076179 RepID=A0A645EF17_9ZZZZ|nr:DUF4973 domain-containing protein [Proteiniphilum sp.]MEA4916659.1 DUF4973 domain-containing protein [Proteiniphilum sp.]
MKNIIYLLGSILAILIICSACNDEWKEEQYIQYACLKAPAGSGSTVTQIRVKYRSEETTRYQLPVIMSGTTLNSKDRDIHIVLDPDTLDIYNREHFYSRTDLYYHLLEGSFYDIPNPVVHIPAGKQSALLDINFKLKDIDLVEQWVLPLKIDDDPSYNYQSHPRKDYNNALLWVTPFNDYSGTYGTTNLSVYTETSNQPIIENQRTTHVVDENSIFFYAGVTKEERRDRKYFKVIATFNAETDSTGTVSLEAAYPDVIKLQVIGQPTYQVVKVMDTAKPTLQRRTVTVSMEYTFEDALEVPDHITRYSVKGTMSMQRNINTLIEDEEFAIEW